MASTPLELAKVAAIAADSKKANDIVLLDLTGKTDVCDYFLICSGGTTRQVDAIVDEIREKVRDNLDIRPLSCEGREGLTWVLLDYGSVVIHVFTPEKRDYYRLERLWGDARRVPLDLEGAASEDEEPEEEPQPVFTIDPEDLEGFDFEIDAAGIDLEAEGIEDDEGDNEFMFEFEDEDQDVEGE